MKKRVGTSLTVKVQFIGGSSTAFSKSFRELAELILTHSPGFKDADALERELKTAYRKGGELSSGTRSAAEKMIIAEKSGIKRQDFWIRRFEEAYPRVELGVFGNIPYRLTGEQSLDPEAYHKKQMGYISD